MSPLFSNGRLSTEAEHLTCVLSRHLPSSGAPCLVYLRLISLPSGNAVTLFNDVTPRTGGPAATCTHTPCPLALLPGAHGRVTSSCWQGLCPGGRLECPQAGQVVSLARVLLWNSPASPPWPLPLAKTQRMASLLPALLFTSQR